MAVQIAKLSTIATLDSTQFGSGIAKMQTGISAFSAISLGAFNRIGAGLVNMTKQTLAALPRMVTASIRAGDELADLSTELGFTTESLSTLQRVAGLAGIEIGGVQSMVGKLNQTLGEAQSGNKAAMESFADLGLSVKSLAGQRPEDVFFAVLEALNQIPGAAKRSAAAVAVLGRGGRPALRFAATDWAAERRTTAQLGLAGSAGGVGALGRASDTLDDLRNNLKGFSDQLAIRISPAITAVGQDFLDFSKKTSLAANAADFFATGMKTAALTIAASLDTMRNAVPFGLLGGGKSYTEQLYDSLNKANQPEAAPAPNMVPGPTGGRKPGKPWANTSGRGPEEQARRRAAANSSGPAPSNYLVPSGLVAPQKSGDAFERFWGHDRDGNRIINQVIKAMEDNTAATKENTKKSSSGSSGGARP